MTPAESRLREAVEHGYPHHTLTLEDARALLADHAEREAALRAEVEALRELLAITYAGPLLYADDGELQDNRAVPFIDFKRDDLGTIRQAMHDRALAQAKEG